MLCINVRKPKSDDRTLRKQMKGFNYSAKRTAISSHYGVIIRKVIYDSYLIARKFIKQNILPISHNIVELAKVTADDKANDYQNVTVHDDGLNSGSGFAVKFEDIDTCDVYYNPVYINEVAIIDGKRNCCFRFQARATFEYACFDTFDCEYNTLVIARDFHEKCLVKKNRKRAEDILFNEQNTGKHFKALDYIRIIFQVQKLNVVDIAKLNTDNLSVAEFHSKYRATIIKYLFSLKKFFHKVNLINIKKAGQVANDPNNVQVSGALNALYTAEAGDFAIAISKGIAGNDKRTVNIYEGKNSKLTVIDYARYTKTKNFVAVSVERKSEPSYFLMIFEDGGKKFYFEMFNNGKNTMTSDPVNLTIKNMEVIKKNLKVGLNYDF